MGQRPILGLIDDTICQFAQVLVFQDHDKLLHHDWTRWRLNGDFDRGIIVIRCRSEKLKYEHIFAERTHQYIGY